MAEFVYREAAPVRGGALTVSDHIRGRYLFREADLARRDALAVSGNIHRRNLLRAGRIFGAAAVIILIGSRKPLFS